MSDKNLEREQLECACIAVCNYLRELLQQKKISAMEFVSIVEQLPIKPGDFAQHRGLN